MYPRLFECTTITRPRSTKWRDWVKIGRMKKTFLRKNGPFFHAKVSGGLADPVEDSISENNENVIKHEISNHSQFRQFSEQDGQIGDEQEKKKMKIIGDQRISQELNEKLRPTSRKKVARKATKRKMMSKIKLSMQSPEV